jgi:carbamoyl-phosphate synthase large subunit
VDKYLIGREIEVDAICDGEDILIPGIMEHVERAGVHSGDSMSVYPPQNIGKKILDEIVSYTEKLSCALRVSGMINIQYIEHRGELYVIEVNPRSSRTVPYISKVTGVPMIELATRCAMGQRLSGMGYGAGLYPAKDIVAVKVPVFSFEKLPDVEVSLGPEMKSTGEVLGVSPSYQEALYKGMAGAGYRFAEKEKVLITVADADKPEAVNVASELESLGYEIWATPRTARALRKYFVEAHLVYKLHGGSPDMESMIKAGEVSLIINTPTKGRDPLRDGFRIRRLAVESGVPCITSMDTAEAFVKSLRAGKDGDTLGLHPLEEIK